MKTIVLGGNGFLGGAIAQELIERDHDVTVIDVAGSQATCDARFGAGAVEFVEGDILDPELLRRRFSGADEVYHLAGKLGTSELDDTPTLAVHVNVLGSINVFEAAIEAGVARVFHASKPNVWLNAYTITKGAAEQLGALYDRDASGTQLCSLRYFNAFGPHQAHAPVRKLVPTFVRQALRGEPLEVYGDGNQIVDLIYVRDAASMTVRYMRAEHPPDAIAPDCGRGVPVTVNQVADTINDATGNRAGVRHLPMRSGEDEGTELVACTEPLLASIDGFRFTDWEQSLEQTIAWYASHDRER
ncbi:MAG TPA: NAD(P)-dependent oxidoreductase [Conexibacter sp.]|nr:NAD(P)-dependent oxidoreductase [Conexibacter sp.]